MNAKTRAAWIEAAHIKHGSEGNIEIDPNAKISKGADGNGAYVAAWVWVYNDEKADAVKSLKEAEEKRT